MKTKKLISHIKPGQISQIIIYTLFCVNLIRLLFCNELLMFAAIFDSFKLNNLYALIQTLQLELIIRNNYENSLMIILGMWISISSHKNSTVLKAIFIGILLIYKVNGSGENYIAFSNTGNDIGYDIIPGFSDSYSYIIGNRCWGGNNADIDHFCMKIDTAGTQIWKYHSGSPGGGGFFDQLRSGVKTSDNNIMVFGYCTSSGTKKGNIFKLADSNGALINSLQDVNLGPEGQGIITDSGSYITIGKSTTGGVIATVSASYIVSNRLSFSSPSVTELISIDTNTIGKIGVLGNSASSRCVLITGYPGSTTMTSIGFTGANYCYKIRAISGGGMLVAGYIGSGPAGGYDAVLIKLNNDFTEDWKKTIGYGGNDEARGVDQMPSGDLIWVGTTDYATSGGKDAWLFITTPTGDMILEKKFGTPAEDYFNAVYSDSVGVIRAVGASYIDATRQFDVNLLIARYCPIGTYLGATSCVTCPSGYYNDVYDSNPCKACPGGKTCDSKSVGAQCNIGYYLEATTWGTSCKNCPTGTYADTQGQIACTPCPGGKLCSDTGVGSDCTDGNYVLPNTWKSACIPCPGGKLCTKDTLGSDCDLGTYALAGTWYPACLPCPGGKTCTINNIGADCVAGKYLEEHTWGSVCKDCSNGMYQDRSGKASCEPCPGGKPCSATGLGADCASGYYVLPNTWQDPCIECPGAKPCIKDSVGSDCPSGEYAETGKYYPSCAICPGGKLCSKLSVGTECVAGKYLEEHTWAISCKDCLDGTYQDQTGKKSCNPCPGGKPCSATGTGDNCLPGHYILPNAWKTSCSVCPGGKPCTIDSIGSDCIDGYYVVPVTWEPSCKACPGGYTCSKDGTGTICSPGTYLPDIIWSSKCTDCELGKYADTSGQLSCTFCPGSQVCTAVLLGTICSSGWYTLPNQWYPACLPCPGGQLCSSNALGTLCLDGTYVTKETWKTDACTACSGGHTCSNLGLGSICTEGTYFPENKWTAKCTDCENGKYQNMQGQVTCQWCPGGRPCSATEIGSPCTDGHYVLPNQWTDPCIDCPGGKVCTIDSVGATCMMGFYAPLNHWAPACIPCEEGSYQPDPGQNNCIKCNAGTANQNKQSISPTECKLCDPGFYSKNPGSATCTKCPDRSKSSSGATICTCDDGAYYDPSKGLDYCPGIFISKLIMRK